MLPAKWQTFNLNLNLNALTYQFSQALHWQTSVVQIAGIRIDVDMTFIYDIHINTH